jgi:flagellar hook-associated protein 1 FlgK
VGLSAALSIASGGLANVQSQLALVSHNVANASTPGYAAEVGTQQSLDADGTGFGVRTGPATRNIDMALQAQVFRQNATVAGLLTRQSALQAIDAVQGTPGQNTDIASLLTNLQNQFSTLLNDPSNQAQQSQVVSSATNLARNINTLSNAYTTQRQAAQDNIVAEVDLLNTTLGTIGNLSSHIVEAKATGQSTADYENQRDAAVATLSQLVDVKLLQQPNGDVLVTTSAGLPLPTHSVANQLSTSDASMQPGALPIPPIMLGGVDVTQQLQGGQIGANITLRDATLPTDQAELDEFAQNMADRFSANGLRLFTDPLGNVPVQSALPLPVQANYVGFAATIQVDQAVQQTPSLVRDGNWPQLNLPPMQYAGFANVINAVLNTTFGATPVLGTNTSGLGSAGTLSAPYSPPSTLVGLAATMTAAQAQDSASTSSQLSTEQAVQTTLSSKLSSQSGVNMDTEMSNMIALQNTYGANAKVIAAVQTMWAQLLNTVS